jgi:hypothetical protein
MAGWRACGQSEHKKKEKRPYKQSTALLLAGARMVNQNTKKEKTAKKKSHALLLAGAQVVNQNIYYCWLDSTDWLSQSDYRLCMAPPKQSYQRLLAGGLAGALSRSLVSLKGFE